MDVPDAVLPHGDADGQVDEEAGEPAARRDADRRHGDEQDERADEQELVEVVDSQGPFLPAGETRYTRREEDRGQRRTEDEENRGDRRARGEPGNYFVTLPNS
ncbi:hypothetical protein GCM10010238_18640 [Streptomyces griseoviridis]|uniref:Uncharacterized protein n=1 Tax=Streptomyces griseoviridis TaxID=45398 RepID=A0A918GDG3_STRGD|nr:hypothetical protein GCM10010238_18640 [Streptomyces niveoruber]